MSQPKQLFISIDVSKRSPDIFQVAVISSILHHNDQDDFVPVINSLTQHYTGNEPAH